MINATRRDVLKGAAALGVATALTPMAAKAAPKQGGRLRLALEYGTTTDSYDPAT